MSRIITILCVLAAACSSAAAAPAPSEFTFYDMPTAVSGPCDTCEGSDGALWVQNMLAATIVRIDPKTGAVEEHKIPYTLPPLDNSVLPGLTLVNQRTALACAIRPGLDGNLYAATGIRNQFLRINPTTRKIDVFTPKPYNPAGDLQPFNDLTAGPNGMFFSQTTGNVISHFDYKTEEFTNFLVPTPLAAPLGMIYFRDHLWFSELLGNKIGRLNPIDGTFKEYPLPLPGLAGPAVNRAALTNPDRVCFTAFLGGGNGCIEVDTGKIVDFPHPGLGGAVSLPSENTQDLLRKNIIYYSTATQNDINVLNVTSGEITKIKEPDTLLAEPVSLPFYFDIGMNYGPGDAVWFTNALANRVGRYQLS